MKEFPGSWIIMRGNHDDRYWDKHCEIRYDENNLGCAWIPYDNGWLFDEDGFLYQKKYPNIKYVEDEGSIHTINGYNFLFVPGAYSVDKQYRLENSLPYNPSEQLTEVEQQRLLRLVQEYNDARWPIDFVIGHTFPLVMESYYKDLFLNFIDQSSVDKTSEIFLNKLSLLFEQNFAFKQYIGGHFHADRQLTSKYLMLYHDVIDIEDYL